MSKTEEVKTFKGWLFLQADPEEEIQIEEWMVFENKEDEYEKGARLDRILNDFESHEIEVTIKVLNKPRSPPQ